MASTYILLQVLKLDITATTCKTKWSRGIDGIEFTSEENTAASIHYRARLHLPGKVFHVCLTTEPSEML